MTNSSAQCCHNVRWWKSSSGGIHSSGSLQNKSAFLCGVMKTYRQREKQGTKVSDSNKGPDEAKIKVSPH